MNMGSDPERGSRPSAAIGPTAAAARLASNAVAIEGLVRHVSDDQARWRPDPSQWSILEVVNHLVDEEVEDFRHRLEMTLFDPQQAWPAIEPQSWPATRGYLSRELGPSLAHFLEERRRSVAWLRGIGTADMGATHDDPSHGPLRAGDLLAAWLAHDLIHVRQLTHLHYQWLERAAAPYRTDYAGPF